MLNKLLTNFLAKNPKKAATYLLGTISIACILFASNVPLRINSTASMPVGFYWLLPPREVHTGDLVMVCLNNSRAQYALIHGYLHAGSCFNSAQPLLKQVVAVTNDTVTLSTSSVRINNVPLPHSSTLATDKRQQLIQAAPRGIYKLQTNQLWLYGIESDRSWDSRYFGLAKVSDVTNIVKPILTWQGE